VSTLTAARVGDALVASARAGHELRYPDGPPPDVLAEAMLEGPTAAIRAARERNPALAALELEAGLERLEHEWIAFQGLQMHLEVHPVSEAAPTLVIAPGLGDHARRQVGLAVALAERGLNCVVVDRRGHGISEGRRGDATLEADFALLESAIGFARSRFEGPVVLLGDSLGGIMSWYLLTRKPDVEAAVCHCVGHPDVHHDPSFRFKAPLIRALARVAPYAPIPVRQIADYDHVALDPETKRYFDERIDRLFNFEVTARSVASYVGFRPAIPWQRVTTPVLVLIGSMDRMVSPEFTRRSLAAAAPPRAEYVEVEGAGHQLFLDDLGLVVDPLERWLRAACA